MRKNLLTLFFIVFSLPFACKKRPGETFIIPPVQINSPYNLGRIEMSDTVRFSVSYRNTGSNDIQMNYIVTPCGCTTAIPDLRPLAANDSSKVQIIYVPTKTGYVEENLFLYFKPYENPIHLQIRAKIK